MRECYLRRAPNLAFRILGDEAVIMNPADSTLFNLNDTATAIWKAADGNSTLRQIVERELCAGFEVDPETALAEAEEFAEALASHSILLVSTEPAGGDE